MPLIRLNNPTIQVNWSRFCFGVGVFRLWSHRDFQIYFGPVIFTVCF